LAKRTDSNQSRIVNALRDGGASVTTLHTVGNGCPDIVVGLRGVNYLIEIKTDTGKLNSNEIRWHKNWNGQVAIVRTIEEAIELVFGENNE
jgi:Holliday junction resolvase